MSNIKEDEDQVVNTDSTVVNGSADLPDSPKDEEEMKSETVTMDLPDVEDIPGQEHVHVMPMGDLSDDTISSGDEEGDGITGFNDEDDDAEEVDDLEEDDEEDDDLSEDRDDDDEGDWEFDSIEEHVSIVDTIAV